MKDIQKINRNLFNIYLLFTRHPFVRYFTQELEFYSNLDRRLLGLISLDKEDGDFYTAIFSRDKSRQYRAEKIEHSLSTIKEARDWILNNLTGDSLIQHEEQSQYFDLFKIKVKPKQLHPYFKLLNEEVAFEAAKEVIKEVSYHYKDIDGNFIDQFQSINGFDSRLWELYLFCFCREELFSFKRNSHSPDYIIEKFGKEVAIEAVIVGRNRDKPPHNKGQIDLEYLKNLDNIEQRMINEMPLKFGSPLFDKLKKKYWELPHVQGHPFVIAIADFHEDLSMTWSFSAIIDYLYGTKYTHYHDDKGELIITPSKIKEFTKPSGSTVPAGFFFQSDAENVSAIIFSSIATLSKFNRMGKQAGLGSQKCKIIRSGLCYNHDKNASKPNFFQYTVDESSKETWAEGVSIFHNPNAKIPLDKDLFPSVAHHEFRDNILYSENPPFLPYNSINQNIVIKE